MMALLRGLAGAAPQSDVTATVLRGLGSKADDAEAALARAGYGGPFLPAATVPMTPQVRVTPDTLGPVGADLHRGNVAGVIGRELGEVPLPEIGNAPVSARAMGELTALFSRRFGLGRYEVAGAPNGEALVDKRRGISLDAGMAEPDPTVWRGPEDVPLDRQIDPKPVVAAHEISHQIGYPRPDDDIWANVPMLVQNNALDRREVPRAYAEMLEVSRRISRPENWLGLHQAADELIRTVARMSPQDAMVAIRQPARGRDEYFNYLASEDELFADLGAAIMTDPKRTLELAPTVASAFRRYWDGVRRAGVRAIYRDIPLAALAWAFYEADKQPRGDDDPMSLMEV